MFRRSVVDIFVQWTEGFRAASHFFKILILIFLYSLLDLAYMPTVTALPYLLLKIMKINSAFGKYRYPLKSSRFCHSWKTTTTNTAFLIFAKSNKCVLLELTKVSFGCVAHARKTEMIQIYSRKCSVRAQKIGICKFALGSALCVHERHEAKKVSPKRTSHPWSCNFQVE